MNIYGIIILATLLVDYISKRCVLATNCSSTGHLVDATLVLNTGTMWGLFSNLQTINMIFIIISIVVAVALTIVTFKQTAEKYYVSFALILGGILGNLVDRIEVGAVVDWINFHFWPVFNIADSFISIAALIFLSNLFWRHR